MAISVIGAAAPAARSERTVFITSTQSWTTPADVTSVDILLVGGGGGGGGAQNNEGSAGGGAGGGGVLQTSLAVTSSTAYTITIGGGGTGGNNSPTPGAHGSASTFGSLATSYGGGGAQATNGTAPANPTIRIASTGGWGTPNGYIGGKGGGAGQIPVPYRVNSAVFNEQLISFIGQGTPGVRDGDVHAPNPGLNGFGAGGGGSIHGTNASNSIFGGVNAGNGGRYTVSAAENGVANYGGGGGGAARNASGGNGGSGVCIIKYWSAL